MNKIKITKRDFRNPVIEIENLVALIENKEKVCRTILTNLR